MALILERRSEEVCKRLLINSGVTLRAGHPENSLLSCFEHLKDEVKRKLNPDQCQVKPLISLLRT